MEQIGPLQTQVMHVLWDLGGGTVQKVMESINAARAKVPLQPLAYTTFLTVMRNLARRKFLDQQRANGFARSHNFVPLVTEGEYKKAMMRQMLDGLFEGDRDEFIRNATLVCVPVPPAKAS